MVMYQIGFMSTIMLLLYYFLNTSAASKVLIQSVVVLCVSLLSAILLFGTRIFQLYTTGDIDLQEIVRQQTMMTSQTHMQHTYNGSSDRETELEDEIAELKKKLKSAAIHPMNLQNQDIEIGGSSNGGAWKFENQKSLNLTSVSSNVLFDVPLLPSVIEFRRKITVQPSHAQIMRSLAEDNIHLWIYIYIIYQQRVHVYKKNKINLKKKPKK